MVEEIINIKGRERVVINKRKLDVGIRIERKEHGFNLKISRKIAMDHIRKNPNYYTRRNRKITTLNNGHRHTWKLFNKRTSVNDGHSHPIDFNKKIAKMGKTNHTHRLLMRGY